MNLILCGLPMCGKSTLGKTLAEALNRTFIDTDREIENSYAKTNLEFLSCRQIFSKEGNAEFRKLEKQQLLQLMETKNSIIALGGGFLLDPENRVLIKSLGYLLYLKSPPQTLWERTVSRGIPAYLDLDNPEQSYYKICEERIPIYEMTADGILNMEQL